MRPNVLVLTVERKPTKQRPGGKSLIHAFIKDLASATLNFEYEPGTDLEFQHHCAAYKLVDEHISEECTTLLSAKGWGNQGKRYIHIATFGS